MKKLSTRTVGELKMIAREQGIELPDGALKAQILEAIEFDGGAVITANTVSPSGKKTSGVAEVKNGVIGMNLPENQPVKQAVVSDDKVALYSEKNLSWVGVGKLKRGYNFVSEGVSEKWLKQKAVRLASPEEVADHYGVS